jgi:hypothetical protein
MASRETVRRATTCLRTNRADTPRAKSAGLTAQTSQCVCVMSTSGASAAMAASSISYSGWPECKRVRTRSSISRLDPVMSKVGRLTAGSRLTQAG